MKFVVLYSLEKDIWNHLKTNWKFQYLKHGRKNIQDKLLKHYPENYKTDLREAKTEQQAKKAIVNFLESLPNHIKNTTEIITIGLESILNKSTPEIINKLESVYKEKFPFNKISVYLTTASIYPYNFKERWYMTGRNQSIEGHLKTTLHELNHFMFYYYYQNLKDELGQEKFEILKEALAIYTNPEGNDKPNVKNLENYFRKHLTNSIPSVLEAGEWRNYI